MKVRREGKEGDSSSYLPAALNESASLPRKAECALGSTGEACKSADLVVSTQAPMWRKPLLERDNVLMMLEPERRETQEQCLCRPESGERDEIAGSLGLTLAVALRKHGGGGRLSGIIWVDGWSSVIVFPVFGWPWPGFPDFGTVWAVVMVSDSKAHTELRLKKTGNADHPGETELSLTLT